MAKQRKHIRHSKRGKKFIAGSMSLEQRVTKLLKPMIEKEMEGSVVQITIDSIEDKDFVSGWAKIGVWHVPESDESPFGEETDYFFSARLDKNNKPHDLEFPMEEDVMFGGKIGKKRYCPYCGTPLKDVDDAYEYKCPKCGGRGHSEQGDEIGLFFVSKKAYDEL